MLQVVHFDLPEAGPGEVRVRVKAAGVQPFDVAVRKNGWAPPGRRINYPQILGNEFMRRHRPDRRRRHGIRHAATRCWAGRSFPVMPNM